MAPAFTAPTPDLFEAFFDLALIGGMLFAPVRDAAEKVVDFTYVRLNPAAQQMLALPEHPPETFLTLYPNALQTGVFAFYREAFEAGEARRGEFNYQHDGLDNYFHLAARRLGEQLLVSFTDTSEQPRSAVEEALRESQAREQAARAEADLQRKRFYEVLLQLPAQVATYHGPDHVFTFVNQRFSAFVPSQNLLGRPVREAAQGAVGQEVFALLDRVYATGEPVHLPELEVVLDHHDDAPAAKPLFVTATYLPLHDGDGHIYGVLDFSYEVTEQVLARRQVEQLNQELEARVQRRTQELAQAQAETEAQRQRLHKLVAEAPAMIASLRGPEHVVELANENFRAIFGGRELVGKTYREAIPEFATQPFFDYLDRVYRTGETYYGIDDPVILDRTNSGQLERTFITYTYQATHDAQGQVDGILVFCYEVTQQVLARQEREAQRSELQRLFEQAPVAIAVFRGPQYVIELANSSVCALWGRTQPQALGTPLFELLPEAAGQGFEELLDQVRATGVPFVAHELPSFIDRDGRRDTVYWNFVYAPLWEADGTIERITVVATEGTEQVLARQQVSDANEALTRSNQQLTRTNVDLDTFVYTASHDLKAPITNIESILLALRETLPAAVQQDELVAHLLDLLGQTVTRFQLTIGQLTDLSKLQLAHAGPAEPVYLAPVVEAVRLDLAPLIAAADAQLTVDVAPDLVASFSPANLRSVVYNLLSNAVKYRALDRACVVQVRAERGDDAALVFTVQDNGLGMSELQQRQLFGLFQRLHTHVEGTGVGLYITKRLVENGGGTIAVRSQPDVGTTFTVTFPV